MGIFQGIGDVARVVANGATFGGADWLGERIGNTSAEEDTAEAYQRLGRAAPILYGASAVLGGPVGVGGKAVMAGAKALRGAIAGRAAAAGAATGAPKFIPAVIRNNPKKAIGAAVGIPLVVSWDAASRSEQARTAAQPKAVALEAPRAKQSAAPSGMPSFNSAGANEAEKQGTGAGVVAEQSMPTFMSMAQNLEREQGAGLSLNQVTALADIANKLKVSGGGAAARMRVGERGGTELENSYLAQYQRALADPNVDPAAALAEFEMKMLQLRKTEYMDPTQAYRMSGQ